MRTAFSLESNRLLIQPLTYAQALQYRAGELFACEDLDDSPLSYSISPNLSEALDNFLLPKLKEAGADYLVHTIWLMREKQTGAIAGRVGAVCRRHAGRRGAPPECAAGPRRR